MSHNKKNTFSFNDLGRKWREESAAEKQSNKEDLWRKLETADDSVADRIQSIEAHEIAPNRRDGIAAGIHQLGKNELVERRYGRARECFMKARELCPHDWLYQQRAQLIDAVVQPGTIDWNLRAIEVMGKLQLHCSKVHCSCETHLQIGECQKALETNFNHETFLWAEGSYQGVEVYTVGRYFAYTQRTRWTKWLKQLKLDCKQELISPLAQILADVVIERTPVLRTGDLLVPVPPDTGKFVKRGFAPNDGIAGVISERFAMPVRHALIRRGGDTRNQTVAALAKQFRVEPSEEQYVRGRTVVLVEDIWTKGRTIPICAQHLRQAGAKEVVAVALGDADF
jgi:predicted amidophosphoribosyltransferase